MTEYQFGPRITPMVRSLIIINVAVFLIQSIFAFGLYSSLPAERSASQFLQFFALQPFGKGFFIWQIFTYMFLHGGIFHLLFNMLALWMFGSELEEEWGSKEFLRYYLINGTGAGLIIFLIPLLLGQTTGATLGASGAIFSLLLAYAIYWPNRTLLFMMIFPIQVKYFVLIFGLLSLYLTFASSGMGGVSHVGHLGGLISGYLYLMLASKNASTWQYSKWNLAARWKLHKQKKLWEKNHKRKSREMDTQEKVDALLEKISRYGMKSLSPDEKRFLKKVSRNLDDNNSNIH